MESGESMVVRLVSKVAVFVIELNGWKLKS